MTDQDGIQGVDFPYKEALGLTTVTHGLAPSGLAFLPACGKVWQGCSNTFSDFLPLDGPWWHFKPSSCTQRGPHVWLRARTPRWLWACSTCWRPRCGWLPNMGWITKTPWGGGSFSHSLSSWTSISVHFGGRQTVKDFFWLTKSGCDLFFLELHDPRTHRTYCG